MAPSAIHQDLGWVNEIAYVDSAQQEHRLAVLDCRETSTTPAQPAQVTHYQWLTNFTVSNANVIALANQEGRLRWKIENEGFNNQKQRGFELEHPYSHNRTARKVFYFLLQMAHLLFQLMEKGSLFRRAFPEGVGSSKNLAWRLLEAWRNWRGSAAELERLWTFRFQIRFNSTCPIRSSSNPWVYLQVFPRLGKGAVISLHPKAAWWFRALG